MTKEQMDAYMKHLGFKRVRSKILSFHEGWGRKIGHGSWAVLWDGSCWTYPEDKEVEVLDDKLELQKI